ARQIATHLIACAAAGVQAALRVGGDRGMDELVAGLHLAAATLGPDEEGGAGLRQAHIRVEQALFVDFQALSALLEYGVMPSIQPAACSAFGGADGPWAAKVGVPRAADMSPVADLTTAGLTVAFGSGAPRTPLNPWTAIRAALFHQDESQRLTLHEAFFAHTTAGWRLAAGAAPGAGILAPGHPAHLAIWRAEDYVSQDESLPTWAAQPPLPPLPALQPDGRDPECLRTVRAGVTIHDTLA
ncbi:MAG: amidohydrolase family protein, partial [Promicromonosporaceae bacterium]|nr:amidohydrolase family protein [Promicromonosporaceae bacterium]